MRPRPIDPALIPDVLEIEQLIYCYPIALDTRDYDALDEIFAADAELVMGGRAMTTAEYKEMCRINLGKLDATHHHVTAPVIQIGADGASARAHAYHQGQHVLRELKPDQLYLIAGWTDDEMAKRDGRWLITKRVWTSVWSSGNPAVLGR